MSDLYDEFGNYIGGSDFESSSESDQEDASAQPEQAHTVPPDDHESQVAEISEGMTNAVVLHEDKQYYPTAQQVYGDDVEILVQEEDAQSLSVPIIAPVVEKKHAIEETDLPEVNYKRQFMADLMAYPAHSRNITLAGHLHHGKTAFLDMLVLETHNLQARLDKRTGRRRDEQLRYSDNHPVEQARGLSIRATPMSILLQNSKSKSYVFNMIDTPGHANFADEIAVSMRLSDGLVLIVDVIEGLQVTAELALKNAVLQGIPIVLIINKVDRLILELKLPPADAYFKLKHVVEEVNSFIEDTVPGRGHNFRLSPERGNVAFASASTGWCFTLPSFARMYADRYPSVDPERLAERLWGDFFFNPSSRKFSRRPMEEKARRSFVHFILDPVYKLYSHTIGQSPDGLMNTLSSLGIVLKPSEYKTDAKILLGLVCKQFFGNSSGFVDMVVKCVPSPIDGAARYIEKYYTGPQDSVTATEIKECSKDGSLVLHATKMYHTPDAKRFNVLCRVLSGTVTPGATVRVLGEGYTIDDDEDMAQVTVEDVWIPGGRYNVPVSGVPAGNFVLLSGVDGSIFKTATIVATQLKDDDEAYIFTPVRPFLESVFKVSAEPINPSELPKMLEGLRKITKSYTSVATRVEESGEHVILGTGELYMDCVLHDLRRIYAEIEVKVSDPVTRFCETVLETSALKCPVTTPNKKNVITMVSEPLDGGIAEDIEAGAVSLSAPVREVGKFFQDRYGFDLLSSRNIWAFGPDETGPNMLLNDTLPSKVDAKLLRATREGLRQGFVWAAREGPLCEEPMRNVKFRLTDIDLASEPIYRGGGQVIPTARRACYSSFLTAGPRLMEPMYACHMIGPIDAVSSLHTVLSRRRGHVTQDGPIPGTPLYQVKGIIPVIDSFGFETDLRIHTQGQATVSLVFDKWSLVPGDPLDTDIKLQPLEPAPLHATARDFLLKTRRRKGLSEDVNISKFLEPEMLASLRELGIIDK